MDNDDKDKITLRDQLAIATLSTLIEKYSIVWAKGQPGNQYQEQLDAMSRTAYEIADAMRKARLQTFT